MDKEQTVKEAFDLIRNSEELGRDSMSTYDECFSDEELMEDLNDHYDWAKDSEDVTPKGIYDFYVMLEGVRMERERDIDNGMGW